MGSFSERPFPLVFALGCVLRFGLMVYGRWQDKHMVVKYTDIDYHVFTDAAEYITKGQSPYMRPTYRYTPLLAWLVTPNVTLCADFGKIMFIICDIWAGYLLYRLLQMRRYTEMTATLCASFWLLNPLPATVSSRGNAESVIVALVLGTIYLIMKQGIHNLCLAGLLYGSSVHFKIYPVTYALPIYLMLDGNFTGTKPRWTLFSCDILPNSQRIVFVVSTVFSFVSLTLLCYTWYGWDFLEETYLYHVTRRDIKHNFSIYFYMMYLTAQTDYSWIIGLTAFIPQASLLLISSWYYRHDLPFCCFVNTFVFVTFNKVCTSQYFLWYLSLLPLVIPSLELGTIAAIAMPAAWFLGQGLWLTPAYYLEFEGKDTYFLIWLASIAFFIINCTILWKITVSYKHSPLFLDGSLVKMSECFSMYSGNKLKRRPLHANSNRKEK